MVAISPGKYLTQRATAQRIRRTDWRFFLLQETNDSADRKQKQKGLNEQENDREIQFSVKNISLNLVTLIIHRVIIQVQLISQCNWSINGLGVIIFSTEVFHSFSSFSFYLFTLRFKKNQAYNTVWLRWIEILIPWFLFYLNEMNKLNKLKKYYKIKLVPKKQHVKIEWYKPLILTSLYDYTYSLTFFRIENIIIV